jgi:hypothetical protein
MKFNVGDEVKILPNFPYAGFAGQTAKIKEHGGRKGDYYILENDRFSCLYIKEDEMELVTKPKQEPGLPQATLDKLLTYYKKNKYPSEREFVITDIFHILGYEVKSHSTYTLEKIP